jgi:hypothetical protein
MIAHQMEERCQRSLEHAPLVQAAWAASYTKNSYLAAQYRRLARRKGRKRALVAGRP